VPRYRQTETHFLAGPLCFLRVTDIIPAAVLSGNRNFEGRVHPQTRANYLASPPLVVAYALAGTVCTSQLWISLIGLAS